MVWSRTLLPVTTTLSFRNGGNSPHATRILASCLLRIVSLIINVTFQNHWLDIERLIMHNCKIFQSMLVGWEGSVLQKGCSSRRFQKGDFVSNKFKMRREPIVWLSHLTTPSRFVLPNCKCDQWEIRGAVDYSIFHYIPIDFEHCFTRHFQLDESCPEGTMQLYRERKDVWGSRILFQRVNEYITKAFFSHATKKTQAKWYTNTFEDAL